MPIGLHVRAFGAVITVIRLTRISSSAINAYVSVFYQRLITKQGLPFLCHCLDRFIVGKLITVSSIEQESERFEVASRRKFQFSRFIFPYDLFTSFAIFRAPETQLRRIPERK